MLGVKFNRGFYPREGRYAVNGDETEMLIVDFTDAFKHLVINLAERSFLAGQCKLDGEDGFFVYLVLLFGAIAGPLLWGRLAAWLMRASAATAPVGRLGLQSYVDDPFLVARGTKKGRTIEFGCILLLWRALDCCLAILAQGHFLFKAGIAFACSVRCELWSVFFIR